MNHKKLYKSLCNMIDWTFEHQAKIPEKFKSYLNPLAWLKESCTIKFCLPRQSGHTTFAEKLMKTRKCCYLAPEMCARRFMEKLEPKLKGGVSWPSNLNRIKGKSFDILIVDVSSMMSNKQIDNIYDFCRGCGINKKNFCILFLE